MTRDPLSNPLNPSEKDDRYRDRKGVARTGNAKGESAVEHLSVTPKDKRKRDPYVTDVSGRTPALRDATSLVDALMRKGKR